MCNSPNVRAFEVALSLAMSLVGIFVLWRARKGKPTFYLRYFGTTKQQGLGCSTAVAIMFILLGIFVFISAILYLDC
jgi:multisubunit Na+/H+ antiporter MnhG subunit